MDPIRRIPSKALESLDAECTIIDVREPGEFSGRRWPGSLNVPLSRLEASLGSVPKDRAVVVLCQIGRRSWDAAERLAGLGYRDVRVVEGGLDACARGCLESGPGGAWAMERQVRFAAGALVLLGAALGFFVHPWGWALCAGVGAGLVFSAVTDTCAMARVLALLPWNRRG